MTGSKCTFSGIACLLFIATCLSSSTYASDVKIDDFTLATHRGIKWSLQDVKDAKLVVVTFLGTECPLARLYGPRLAALEARYKDQGVTFVGVNSNTQDSMTELTAYAARHEISFPLLKDVGNVVADQFEAERTPEVFLLDQQRNVRYRGRIDDQYLVGFSRDKVRRHDLTIAIDELLHGKNVSVPQTEALGCHIGRVTTRQPHGTVTYTNQISRIFNRRCVECHRSGEVAPFTLTKFEDIIGWEDTILEVIADNRMPPWFANPAHGTFSNDARMTPDEIRLVKTWVRNGMPEGDPSQLPAPPKFTKGWKIPEPDQVINVRSKPFKVPADGIVDYQYFRVDPQWNEDRYIYAAEARPGNAAVVHHIIAYVIPPDVNPEDDDSLLRNMLVGYAPGAPPRLLKDGVAMFVPAGSKLIFELHYTPNGTQQTDLSRIGVSFLDKKDVKKLLRGGLAINTKFEIPPKTSNHVVKARYVVRQDEMLMDMTPHMHLRGKAFRYEAHYPNGTREILLDVPNYDFNWQLSYKLAEPKLLPRGTRIKCTAVFDNSKHNLVNPDPNNPVYWGDQSWEEMMIGFLTVVDADAKDNSVSLNRR